MHLGYIYLALSHWDDINLQKPPHTLVCWARECLLSVANSSHLVLQHESGEQQPDILQRSHLPETPACVMPQPQPHWVRGSSFQGSASPTSDPLPRRATTTCTHHWSIQPWLLHATAGESGSAASRVSTGVDFLSSFLHPNSDFIWWEFPFAFIQIPLSDCYQIFHMTQHFFCHLLLKFSWRIQLTINRHWLR